MPLSFGFIPEQGSWRVQYVQFATTTMVGKCAGELRKTAVTENEKQHNFKAFILYAAALQLADRGRPKSETMRFREKSTAPLTLVRILINALTGN